MRLDKAAEKVLRPKVHYLLGDRKKAWGVISLCRRFLKRGIRALKPSELIIIHERLEKLI
jgi:hypothetical protein